MYVWRYEEAALVLGKVNVWEWKEETRFALLKKSSKLQIFMNHDVVIAKHRYIDKQYCYFVIVSLELYRQTAAVYA